VQSISRALASVAAPLLILPAVFGSTAANASPGQLVVDTSETSVGDIVDSLVGPGVSVTNVVYTGADTALGRFSGMGALGLESGIALSTGHLGDDLRGPHGQKRSTVHGRSGDADIDSLVGGRARSHDAAVVEFDFVPRASSLTIDYVFGSMEYLAFVGSGYTDAFGFFINGTNCARVGDSPVSIDTINDKANSALYVNNVDGSHDTSLNGYTTTLTCRADVLAEQKNHAKIVIADVADGKWDSVVLIAAGGLFSNTAPTAGDISFSLDAGTDVDITYPGVDADGDALTYAIVDGPRHGAVVPTSAGAVYSPAEGHIGADSFTYTVSDGIDVSEPYTVRITTREAPVAPSPDDRPAVADVTYTVIQGEDTPITLVARVADAAAASAAADAETVFDITEGPTSGTLRGEGATRIYRSLPDFIGTDGFTYTASRGAVVSAPLRIALDVVGRPVPPVKPRTIPAVPPGPVAAVADPVRSGALARTGVEAAPLAWAGGAAAVAVIAGAALVVVRRRRGESVSRR
jgi:hypothetical protein